jgi:chemotaxis protein CheD
VLLMTPNDMTSPRPPARDGSLDSHYLSPGDIVVSMDPCIVTTILGSCVSVCLTDPTIQVGGVNHYLMPHRDGQQSTRFGDSATQILIERLIALGCRKERLEAKVFGGACLLCGDTVRGDHLGAQNVHMAYEILWQSGIPVTAEDVDGQRGRKLIYQTHDGVAWVKRL